jgi:hypothetical protein
MPAPPSASRSRPAIAGPLGTSSCVKFVGFAANKCDNAAGAAADKAVDLDCASGKILLPVTGAVITDVGQPVYATDDDTFAFSPVSGYFVGYVSRFVSAGVAIVKVQCRLAGSLCGLDARPQVGELHFRRRRRRQVDLGRHRRRRDHAAGGRRHHVPRRQPGRLWRVRRCDQSGRGRSDHRPGHHRGRQQGSDQHQGDRAARRLCRDLDRRRRRLDGFALRGTFGRAKPNNKLDKFTAPARVRGGGCVQQVHALAWRCAVFIASPKTLSKGNRHERSRPAIQPRRLRACITRRLKQDPLALCGSTSVSNLFGSDQRQPKLITGSAVAAGHAPVDRHPPGQELQRQRHHDRQQSLRGHARDPQKGSTRRDKTGQIRARMAEFAINAAQTHWAELVLDARSSTAPTSLCYDGQYFFDTDHTEGENTTNQSNSITVTLSTLSINAPNHGTSSNAAGRGNAAMHLSRASCRSFRSRMIATNR